MGGAGEGGGEVGITIREIAVDTRKQGEVALISEKVFPAAGPTLVLKG